LHLRPGDETVAKLGGIHRFMSWPGSILTDSGGYQVFPLKTISRLTEEGVRFASHLDGRKIMLTTERSIRIQTNLGSDIVMAFDECIPYPAEEAYVKLATERSFRWTSRSKAEFDRIGLPDRLFFGIVQGGMVESARRMSAAAIVDLDPQGLAIGGLSVGESKELMAEVLDRTVPLLPQGKPRYLMGVGAPVDVVRAVCQGVDMFDCVLPTRVARHAHAFTWDGKVNLLNARHREDDRPLDPSCRCLACRSYSRAYLHHLFKSRELLGPRLATLHNLRYYAELMQNIRAAIPGGALPELVKRVERAYGPGSEAGG
ncbi:MAG: tRNA guanosine(34) transglycosylase Tgt, partial [Candidatus Riflebacteria bacterium]|nr:tRNA guanosine(34) transglycosylase Tgt [Candidatus Riflebacteria bacterium]